MPGAILASLLRALIVWVVFIVAESAQGALRRLLLSEAAQVLAREVGVLIGAALIFVLTWASWNWLGLRRARGALAVGGLWVFLTLAFDLGLGRALGAGWGELTADYDPRRGGLLLFGLVAMALAPWAVLRLRGPRA